MSDENVEMENEGQGAKEAPEGEAPKVVKIEDKPKVSDRTPQSSRPSTPARPKSAMEPRLPLIVEFKRPVSAKTPSRLNLTREEYTKILAQPMTRPRLSEVYIIRKTPVVAITPRIKELARPNLRYVRALLYEMEEILSPVIVERLRRLLNEGYESADQETSEYSARTPQSGSRPTTGKGSRPKTAGGSGSPGRPGSAGRFGPGGRPVSSGRPRTAGAGDPGQRGGQRSYGQPGGSKDQSNRKEELTHALALKIAEELSKYVDFDDEAQGPILRRDSLEKSLRQLLESMLKDSMVIPSEVMEYLVNLLPKPLVAWIERVIQDLNSGGDGNIPFTDIAGLEKIGLEGAEGEQAKGKTSAEGEVPSGDGTGAEGVPPDGEATAGEGQESGGVATGGDTSSPSNESEVEGGKGLEEAAVDSGTMDESSAGEGMVGEEGKETAEKENVESEVEGKEGLEETPVDSGTADEPTADEGMVGEEGKETAEEGEVGEGESELEGGKDLEEVPADSGTVDEPTADEEGKETAEGEVESEVEGREGLEPPSADSETTGMIGLPHLKLTADMTPSAVVAVIIRDLANMLEERYGVEVSSESEETARIVSLRQQEIKAFLMENFQNFVTSLSVGGSPEWVMKAVEAAMDHLSEWMESVVKVAEERAEERRKNEPLAERPLTPEETGEWVGRLDDGVNKALNWINWLTEAVNAAELRSMGCMRRKIPFSQHVPKEMTWRCCREKVNPQFAEGHWRKEVANRGMEFIEMKKSYTEETEKWKIKIASATVIGDQKMNQSPRVSLNNGGRYSKGY